MVVKPQTKVPNDCSLYPVRTFIFDNWVNTQKKLSLTCETTIAPAPIDEITNAFSNGVSKPKTTNETEEGKAENRRVEIRFISE